MNRLFPWFDSKRGHQSHVRATAQTYRSPSTRGQSPQYVCYPFPVLPLSKPTIYCSGFRQKSLPEILTKNPSEPTRTAAKGFLAKSITHGKDFWRNPLRMVTDRCTNSTSLVATCSFAASSSATAARSSTFGLYPPVFTARKRCPPLSDTKKQSSGSKVSWSPLMEIATAVDLTGSLMSLVDKKHLKSRIA